MATLISIQKQIADLQKQAESIRKAEANAAAAKAKELISRHQLSAEDVGLGAPATRQSVAPQKEVKAVKAPKALAVAAKPAGIPKFQDPKSGKTWTGNGKPPGWIAGVKNRDKFLITSAAAVIDAASKPTAVDTLAPRKTRTPRVALGAKAEVAAQVAAPQVGLDKASVFKLPKAAAPARRARAGKPATGSAETAATLPAVAAGA